MNRTVQPALDPITLSVLHYRLQNLADEMDITFDQGAFSPIISEGRDRASGIFARGTGALIAQGISGMPIHIGAMQFTAATVARLGRTHRPGDIYIVNDPYAGGTHLMDVKLIMPVFAQGKLFCFLGSSGHWPDTGGSAPGGFATRAVEIHQEGLRIPPVRLYREGELDEDLLELILHNVRVPEQRLGDLQAQIGALKAGEAALHALIDEYGLETVDAAISALHARSAQLMREIIRTLPRGSYEFEDIMDNDGVVDEPLRIHLRLTVDGDRMLFDFSRSSPPCRGPMNSVASATRSAVYVAIKHIFPQIPMNAGCFEPLEIHIPETTFLNAQPPRPVSGCAAEVSQRVVDVVFGAMAQVAPERLHGAPFGTAVNVSVGGYDPWQRKRYVFYFYTGGGHGGYPGGDGISNACSSVGLAKTPPIEIVEQQSPLLFEEYALRPDSCGAGKYRGGLGVRYTLRLRAGEAQLSVLGDRGKQGPFGVLGGGSAATTRVVVTLRGRTYVPPMLVKDENILLSEGDTLTVETPGGGGYGPPAERPAAAIEKDLRRGYVTPEYVAAHYHTVARATRAAEEQEAEA